MFWWLGILHIDTGNQKPGFIAIQNILDQLLNAVGNIGPALREHKIHFVFTDDFAYCTFRRLAQSDIRIYDIEKIITSVLDLVLHGKLYINDVFILGKHERFTLYPCRRLAASAGTTVANRGITDSLDIDNLYTLGEPRIPMQARHGGLVVLTELQYDTAFAFINNIKTGQAIDDRSDNED